MTSTQTIVNRFHTKTAGLEKLTQAATLVTEERKNLLRQLQAQGYSVRQIATLVGLSSARVGKMVQR